MRIEKYLADMSLGTRNDIKKLIREQRITVNGQIVTKAGLQVSETDEIRVDGNIVTYINYEYYLLNKPAGYLCTLDDSPNVCQLVNSRRKDLFPVGRLDKDTEGVIIITNDGQLAHHLISPRSNINKTYYVETDKPIAENAAEIFAQGIRFAEFTSLPAEYKPLSETSGLITIQEGKYHQVKRMFEHIGTTVTYLNRIRFAFLEAEDLAKGEYRPLTDQEIEKLKAL